MVKKRGLGKGLNALLSGAVTDEPSTNKTISTDSLATSLLQRGQYQPRQIIADAPLQELAQSIKTQGIIQPIVVRNIAGGKYEIIAGERRWQAAKIAGLKQVPVVVREVSDSDAIAMALIENIQREDLNPLEEAQALERLIAEFDLTQQQAADAVGKSRSMVANLLRLLGLTMPVRELLATGKLEMGHARALLALDANQQLQASTLVVEKNLTVRETEALVKTLLNPSPKKTAREKSIDPNVRKLQEQLEETLGAKVTIQTKGKSKGMLTIHYHSLDELDGILRHIS